MNLATFDFQEQAIRVVESEGSPWFVASDVCRVLDIQNSRDAVGSLDEDEKITVANNDGNPRAGIPHQYTAISESGLYALVFRSRKPEAKEFRRWVTKEVLPALRQTGRYEVEAEPSATDRAGWDLDAIFEMAQSAGERLLAGTLNAAGAATISTLIQEARKVYELKWRIAPAPPVASLPAWDDDIQKLLRIAADRAKDGTQYRFGDLFAMAREARLCLPLTDGELTRDAAKCMGRRLGVWMGRRLTDSSGREFTLRRHRTKTHAAYVIRFEPTATEGQPV